MNSSYNEKNSTKQHRNTTMKTWDISYIYICMYIKNRSNYNEKIEPTNFENTVNILFHTVSTHLGHSLKRKPQNLNYKEPTGLETNSKNTLY